MFNYLTTNKPQALFYLKAFIIASSVVLALAFIITALSVKEAQAFSAVGGNQPQTRLNVDINKLADAIYKAEGGAKTRHPYGILKHYKTTMPRQACINTIKHALRDWNGRGDFISFLGSRYCPVGCSNDNGTNRYWISNVHKFYNSLTNGGY